MPAPFFPINTPLINYFFFPTPTVQNGPNVPLANGFLKFMDDNDHSVLLPTYSDVSDPLNPIPNPNPLPLGAAGDVPLFYLNNQFYFIQVLDSSMNVIASINHYDPAEGEATIDSPTNGNLISNGNFSFPIEFFQKDKEVGLITEENTVVAWGWEFIQDPSTKTQNIVTFNNVFNEEIESNPIKEIQLSSSNIQSGEGAKDFRKIIGSVNFLESQEVTFSMQSKSEISGVSLINILLEKDYGDGGSDTEIIPITSFETNQQRSKFIFSFTMPNNDSKIIGDNSFLAIRIQVSLGQICIVTFTNVMLFPGLIEDPIFPNEAQAEEVAQILGDSVEINNAGLDQNYGFYTYNDGKIFPYANTGTMTIETLNSIQPFKVICNGGSYSVSGYTNGIPNRRLYNVISNKFGGAGDLVTYSSNNIVFFQSGTGAVEKSVYTSGTTSFTVLKTETGLRFGVTAAIINSNTVQLTWNNNFAPNQVTPATYGPAPPNGVIGNWYNWLGVTSPAITTSTINPGSGITPAVVNVIFNSQNPSDYQTIGKRDPNTITINNTYGYLEFATFSSNSRGTWPSAFNDVIFFSFDGKLENPNGVNFTGQGAIVPLTTGLNLNGIMNLFSIVIANQFQYSVTVNSVPLPSQYFLYSSAIVDYYGWFKVDGIGTDPSIAGRTAVEIDIASTDSVVTVAQKIAAATNSLSFSVPAQADLPVIPSNTKLAWYINL